MDLDKVVKINLIMMKEYYLEKKIVSRIYKRNKTRYLNSNFFIK